MVSPSLRSAAIAVEAASCPIPDSAHPDELRPPKRSRLLIIERSAELREVLTAALADEFRVTTVGTLPLAQNEIRGPGHHGVLLDVALTSLGAEGLDLIRQARAEQDFRPIVVASAGTNPSLASECYQAGADAFLEKPFRSLNELRQLLKRVLDRARPAPLPPRVDRVLLPTRSFRFAGALVEPATMRASFPDGGEAGLTPKEVLLLDYLARNRGRLVLRSEILTEVWGPLADPGSKSLDTHLVRLRKTFGARQVDLGRHLTVQAKLGWWVSGSDRP